ncbi:MAG: hypothetical protein ACLFP1_02635 [Candidatus Goldiibacteriota bacterium]
MNKRLAVEISLLGGALGFFAGGVLGFKKDIVDMLLFAVITGVSVSFLVYFAVYLVFNEELNEDKKPAEPVKKTVKKPAKKAEKQKKGKKIDIVSGEKDDIYNEIFK